MDTICVVCSCAESNCSPFVDEATGQRWTNVCGGCKIKITLADPTRKKALEADMLAMMRAAVLDTKGGKA